MMERDLIVAWVRAGAAMMDLPAALADEAEVVATHLDRLLTGFQFQDRISQMLTLLESDMLRLQQVLAAQTPEVPPVASWLAHLESQYAMDEQRQGQAGPGEAAGSRETDFF
jgi:methyl-accepting chemotaxis protein